ncbi:MAG: hypothetical protein GXO90_10970 [FCB group bacterium]|nr:hypothetical protein [FCB group bacterium]
MSLPFTDLKIIWNPAAGGYRGELRWLALKQELDQNNIPYEVRQSEYPGHATEIVRQWMKSDVDRLGIVGGDGTFNEALNGAFADGVSLQPECRWLFLAAGSSCDFERKFNTGHSSLEKIYGTDERLIDLGRIHPEGVDDAQEGTYFANNSSIGVISLANDKFNALSGPALWLKRITVDGAAILAGLKAIRESIPSEVSITLDGKSMPVKSFSNLTVFKTRFFGGGMGYSRSPRQDDGQFGVAWIEASSRLRLLRLIPTLYTGTVLDYPEAHYAETTTVRITTEAPMVIEADGQIVGTTPASYSLMPKVLRVIV